MKKNILCFIVLLFPLLNISYSQSQTVTTSNKEALREIAHKSKLRDDKAREEALKKGIVIQEIEDDGSVVGFVRFDANGHPVFYSTDNENAAKTVSTNKVWPGGSGGFSLTGNGIDIGEWDGGKVRNTHVELTGRVTQVDGASSLSNHATHVGGTMIASGVDTTAKGMAYQATLSAHDFYSDDPEMATYAGGSNKILSNHSYGRITGWRYSSTNSEWRWYGDTTISTTEDWAFGFYTFAARGWDVIANNAPYYLIIKSAGNDRNDNIPSGVASHKVFDNSLGSWVTSTSTRAADCPTGYDCISSNGNAKNILTVGAVNDISAGYSQPSDVVMSSFSGWGPTDDGRIKPDIVANGVSLRSSSSSGNTAYSNSSGTSMSAPNATGSIALVQEHYHDSNNAFLRAATLKALVIHTADEAGNAPGPDYTHGWGLLNTLRAVQTISDTNAHMVKEPTLSNADSVVYSVYSSGTQPLWATICWNDPAGTPVSTSLDPTNSMLVNDLDIRITAANGTVYSPYTLNPATPAAAATTGDNTRDNVEKVYIANPTAGQYTITIKHKGSLSSPQQFGFVLSGKASQSNTSTAAFTQSDSVICVGDTVTFTDQSTNNPVSWGWLFNGGTPGTSTVQNPTVIYNTPGTYNVSLITVAPSGALDTIVKTNLITVSAIPTVTHPNLPNACLGGTATPLTGGTPAGGTYSGPGVSGNSFTPSTAGLGTHTLTYTVSNGNCSASTTFTITVTNGSGSASLSAFSDVCVSASPFALTGGTPAGGTYSGTGVNSSTGMFAPTIAGVGNHVITYTVNSGGCTASDTASINVTPAPTVTHQPIPDACIGSTQVNLFGKGTPTGGTYSGNGISGVWFSPSNAGVGTHTITYSVTGPGGCVGSTSFTINVVSTVAIQFTDSLGICEQDTAFPLDWALPAGGTYSGAGVSNNMFDPTIAGSGSHGITYSYNINGCSGSSVAQIKVGAAPNVTFLDPPNTFCVNIPSFNLTGGTPNGGTYAGTGVSGGSFNPSTAGTGTHKIVYSFADSTGCAGRDTATYTVIGAGNTQITGLPDSICQKDTNIVLTANVSGGTFTGPGVSNGHFNPSNANIGKDTITYKTPGSQQVCKDSTSKIVTVLESPNISAINGPVLSYHNQNVSYFVPANNGSQYTWSVTNGTVTISNNNVIQIQWGSGSIGEIMVIETGSNGCTDTAYLKVNLWPLSVGELNKLEDFSAFYDHSENRIVVRSVGAPFETGEIQLISLDGKLLEQSTVENGIEQTYLGQNSIQLSQGIYFVRFINSKTVFSKKVLVGF